jgi:hypothetical protein
VLLERDKPKRPVRCAGSRSAGRLDPHRVTNEPHRVGAEQDLTGRSPLLEPARDGHGVAADPCSVPVARDEDLAGVDPELRLDVRRLRRKGRADGSEGVVLVRNRHTEAGHRELPDAFDRSAMVFDRGFHGVVKPPLTEVKRLRISSGRCLWEAGEQDRHRLPRRSLGLGRGAREVERWILLEDLPLEHAELAPRLDAELVDEQLPGVAKHLQRVGLPTRPVQGKHELPAQALVVSIRADERVDLVDDRPVAAELELGVEKLLVHAQALLLEKRQLEQGEWLIDEVRQRRPPPERERLARRPGPLARLGRQPRLLDEPPEPAEVELLVIDVERIAGRIRHDPMGSEEMSQLGHVVLERAAGRRRRILAPEIVDEPISRKRLARVDQEHGEQ